MHSSLPALAELRETLATCWHYPTLMALEARLLGGHAVDALTPEAAMLLGDIRDRRNEWGLAAEAYAAVLAATPADYAAAYRLVTTAIDAGEEPRALHALKSSLLPAVDELDGRELRGLMRTASALGEHAAAMQVFEHAQARCPGSISPAVRLRLETALENQAAPISPLVSLGENCLPWLLPNHWGLRATPADSDSHGPFDLGQSTTERCADILESRFAALVDPLNLTELVPSEGATPMPKNHALAYDFNHEQGRRWIEADFTLLRQRYRARIERFFAQCAADRPVFLHYSEYPGDLVRVGDAVRALRAGRDFRLLIVDVLPDRPLPAESEQIRCLKVQLPRADYRWFGPDDFDSAEGVDWEFALQDFIRRASR
jgi:tetratricopeptide (TPR) repeat protein